MKRFNRIRSRMSGAKRTARLNEYVNERTGNKTLTRDWKSLYKLRHKWSKGSCHYREIPVPSNGQPRAFIRIFNGIAITADANCGIRAWAIKDNGRDLLATCKFAKDSLRLSSMRPSALAINYLKSTATSTRFAIGFADGFIRTYTFDIDVCKFACRQAFAAHDEQRIVALVFSSAYTLSMSSSQVVALHRVSDGNPCFDWLDRPTLLQSLKSHTTGEPISLAFRTHDDQAIISVAYVYLNYLNGWSAGVQELRLTSQGSILQSRIATAQTRSIQSQTTSSSESIRASKGKMDDAISTHSRPLSVAYVHPYLLVNYGDNTLGVHLVRSDNMDIVIGPEMRLWGHTSIVSVHLGERGKAVTVAGGRDVRVWELEEGFKMRTSGTKGLGTISSVKVQPLLYQKDSAISGNKLAPTPWTKSVFQARSAGNLGCKMGNSVGDGVAREATVIFDEERLAVLHDSSLSSRLLSIYDFT